jgi:hypothetical protein
VDDEREDQSDNPITYQFCRNVGAFPKICGFSPADLAALFEPLESILTVPHRVVPQSSVVGMLSSSSCIG